ncbi:hypothetical protein HF325_002486 [Metschnikowia pulcherrima]|uniref:XPG-I domain-containing protein n=1 Tax=Metschnikowia pulcherrima TaxID=27326 RepID=A0A8H7GV65_9ASCO|nr:hypothetical protein HF325_002486 [Metschnikowia pulcherrima]
MPITLLEPFLFENKLVSTSSIDILRDATIGIDVEHYLNRIHTLKNEQLLCAIGGVPASLKQHLLADLDVLRELKIRPLFVLPGMMFENISQRDRTEELPPQERHMDATWARVHSKNPSSSGRHADLGGNSFQLGREPLPINTMINDLVRLFIEGGIDYMISPYNASFQLSYLYRSSAIDCIYGSTDMLLTSIDKLILGMELSSRDFKFVEKQRVLKELNLSERQFNDLSIMVGCCAQPQTFPNFPDPSKANLLAPFSPMNHFRMGLDILYLFAIASGPPDDLFAYVTSLNDQSLLDLYYKGHTAINFMPIMKTDGHIELYSVELSRMGLLTDGGCFRNEAVDKHTEGDARLEDLSTCIPTELHSVISQRLPSEIYFYRSLGLLPSKLLESIVSGQCVVPSPLTSRAEDSYKRLVSSRKLLGILDHQLNLITQLLARYFQVKKIEVISWFQGKPIYVNNRMEPPVFARLHAAPSCQIQYGEFTSIWSNFRDPHQRTTRATHSEKKDIISTSFHRALFLMLVVDHEGSFSYVFQEVLQHSLLACYVDLIARDEELKLRNASKSELRRAVGRMPFFKDLNNTLLGVVSQIYYTECLRQSKAGLPDGQCVQASKNQLMITLFQDGGPSHDLKMESVNRVAIDQFDTDFAEGVSFWKHFKRIIDIAGELNPSLLSAADRELVELADDLVLKFTTVEAL